MTLSNLVILFLIFVIFCPLFSLGILIKNWKVYSRYFKVINIIWLVFWTFVVLTVFIFGGMLVFVVGPLIALLTLFKELLMKYITLKDKKSFAAVLILILVIFNFIVLIPFVFELLNPRLCCDFFPYNTPIFLDLF